MTDYTNLITSEHIDKPKFVAIVALLTGAIDSIRQVIASIQDAFDLDKAVGAQLDIIGLWVGQPRLVNVPITGTFFGFADTPSALPFGENADPSIGGRFYEQGEASGSSTLLLDEEYRTVIRAAIVRNQWDGSAKGLEQALEFIFGAPCVITDRGNLDLTITIGRNITPVEQALLTNFDLLPRPGGVSISTIQYRTELGGVVAITSTATGHL